MEVKGKIYAIGETQQVTDKFKKRDVIIETVEQYPQFLTVQFAQDKTSVLDGCNVGDEVEIGINLRGRLWTNKEGVEVSFNTIQGWKISKPGVNTPPPPAPTEAVQEENDGDGLQF